MTISSLVNTVFGSPVMLPKKKKRRAKHERRSNHRRFQPYLENLEERAVPYALSGSAWANTTVTASFMPDGTQSDLGYPTDLFATLDDVAPTETWQREFARALQTWASVSNLNFYFVPDSGDPSGTPGAVQGDSRFGDIRLGGYVSGRANTASAYYPGGTTRGGDIFLNTAVTFQIGSHVDLYSVLLHESGHSLGLMHTSEYPAVMYPSISTVYNGLYSDDIAGIQAIYGARQADAYDNGAGNNTIGSASTLQLSSGAVSINADLTSLGDVDFYKVVASGSSLTVSVDARNTSLLAPKVMVYDTNGNLLGQSAVGTYGYGTVATLNLSGLSSGATYYLVADGATSDVFGMGAYVLDAQFSGGSTATPPQAPSNLAATAASASQIDLTWQDNSGNEDGFRIERSTDGTNFTLVGTVGVGTTTYSIAGLSPDTTYYFRVSAYNTAGDSAWSNIAQATTLSSTTSTAPTAPSSLTASAPSTDQIDLSWQDNADNEDGFRIEQSADGTNFTLVGTVGANTTTYSVTGLSADTTYHFRVRAYNSTGDSAWSNIAQATTQAPADASLTPDAYEINDTMGTASNLGKINNATVTGLNLNTSSDVDFFAFTPRKTATYNVSLTFAAANGNLDLTVYDANGNMIVNAASSGDNELATLSLQGGQRYYAKVDSPAGDMNTYDLTVAKADGGGKGGGNGNGKGKKANLRLAPDSQPQLVVDEGDHNLVAEDDTSASLPTLDFTPDSAPSALQRLADLFEHSDFHGGRGLRPAQAETESYAFTSSTTDSGTAEGELEGLSTSDSADEQADSGTLFDTASLDAVAVEGVDDPGKE